MEQVILVNVQDQEIGIIEKMEAHTKALLHRAFSIFIFNDKDEMLLQQRSLNKYHSAGLWTNSCCSHPKPGEKTILAAQRRLKQEMGFTTPLSEIFQFTYRTDFENGLTEYELDHVFIGYYSGIVKPDNNEVKDFIFKPIPEIEASLCMNPQLYSYWFRIAFPQVINWWRKQ